MKRWVLTLAITLGLSVYVQAAPENGETKETDGALQVWSDMRNQWVTPELFFADDLASLDGPTYGHTHDYPPYAQVQEWQTLVDVLPDGRSCPMVFFHSRWRRLADVRALDARLRNYGGCRDVFKY